MHIRPADGLKIRDPFKKDLIPEAGREVSDTDPFWCRLLADGDVVIVTAEPDPTPTAENLPIKRQTAGPIRSNDE